MKRVMLVLAFAFLLLLLPLASAHTESWQFFCFGEGTFDQYCGNLLLYGGINSTHTLNDSDIFTDNVYGSNWQPIVADLNDTEAVDTSEIIIWTNSSELRIYTWNLTFLNETSSYGLPAIQYLTTDFDGDGENDIVAIVNKSSSQLFKVLSWDGNNFTEVKSINLSIEANSNNTVDGGMICFDWDADPEIDCIYKDIVGYIHSFDINASSLADDDANFTVDLGGNGISRTNYIPVRAYADSEYVLFFIHGDYVTGKDYSGNTEWSKDWTFQYADSIVWLRVADLDGGNPEVFYNVDAVDILNDMDAFYLKVFGWTGSELWSKECKTSVGDAGWDNRINQSQVGFFDYDGDAYNEIVISQYLVAGNCPDFNTSSNENRLVIFDYDGSILYSYSLPIAPILPIVVDTQDLLITADMNNDGSLDIITKDYIWDLKNNETLYNFSNEFSDAAGFYDTPIPIALNDFTYLGLVATQDGETNVYQGLQIFNYQAEISQLCWNTKSPICFGENLNYWIFYSDFEGDAVYLYADCFGDGSVITNWTQLNYAGEANPLTCPMSQLGSFTSTIYVSDSAHGQSLTLADTINHDIAVALGNCYDSGHLGNCEIEANATAETNLTEYYINKSSLYYKKQKGKDAYQSKHFDWEASGCNEWTLMRPICPYWKAFMQSLEDWWDWLFSWFKYVVGAILFLVIIYFVIRGRK